MIRREIWFPRVLYDASCYLKNILWGTQRFTCLYGGRNGAKSTTVAQFLLLEGKRNKHRILCVREVQNSIRDSVHKLLSDLINKFALDEFYTVTDKSIKGRNGTEFIFKGLSDPDVLKSMEGVSLVWAEEAHTMSEESWVKLIPTIRVPGSRFIITLNPENEDDPTYVRFVIDPPDNCVSILLNYYDNKFHSQEQEETRLDDLRRRPDDYDHIWLGECKRVADAVIFRNRWRVESFPEPPPLTRFYYGLDFGFANDPTALVRCWTKRIGKRETLYIDYEASGLGITTDEYPEKIMSKVPGSKAWTVRGDCSRPETVAQLCKLGYRVVSCLKWKGCIEDGIERLKQFDEIVIHTRCVGVQAEFRKYSYKIDRRTKEILPIVLDKNNHFCDALRYALEPTIKGNKTSLETWAALGK
jgi:phage terminase large subunit